MKKAINFAVENELIEVIASHEIREVIIDLRRLAEMEEWGDGGGVEKNLVEAVKLLDGALRSRKPRRH
jgi:hypothetical protein